MQARLRILEERIIDMIKENRLWFPLVEALYMYSTFGVLSYLIVDGKEKLLPDMYAGFDSDFTALLEWFEDEKFYITDEWVAFFEPKDGDESYKGWQYSSEENCWINYSGLLPIKEHNLPIEKRKGKQFFMPKTEEV